MNCTMNEPDSSSLKHPSESMGAYGVQCVSIGRSFVSNMFKFHLKFQLL